MKNLNQFISIFMFLFALNVSANQTNDEIVFQAIGDVPSEVMTNVKDVLHKHRNDILSRYNISKMPRVTIKVWQDRESFKKSYGENAEYVHGYVVHDLWEARFFNGRPNLGYGVLHEYIHLIQLALNSSFNNNPRWLWEAVAVYESGRPPVPAISSLNCLSENSFPTLSNLEEHPFNIYKVGFYLTDYIIKTWSQEALVKLIKTNGDIKNVLGLKVTEFERNWLQFLKDNYKLELVASADEQC